MPGRVRVRPRRTCVGCRTASPAGELVRVTLTSSGALRVGGGPGRGAYLHRDRSCVEHGVRAPVLARGLRGGVAPDEVGRLRERMERELANA